MEIQWKVVLWNMSAFSHGVASGQEEVCVTGLWVAIVTTPYQSADSKTQEGR